MVEVEGGVGDLYNGWQTGEHSVDNSQPQIHNQDLQRALSLGMHLYLSLAVLSKTELDLLKHLTLAECLNRKLRTSQLELMKTSLAGITTASYA